MSTLNVNDLGQQLDQKRAEYKSKWDSYPRKKLPDGSEAADIPANDVEGLRALMADINDLGAKHADALKLSGFAETLNSDIEKKLGTPIGRIGSDPAGEQPEEKGGKALHQRILTAAKGKYPEGNPLRKGLDATFDWNPRLEMKTAMTTSAGYTPFSARSDVRIDTVQIVPSLIDYLRVIPIGQNSYKFMKETTFTNNAANKAEGSAYGEAALALTETTITMERLGVFLPVTEDQLEDEPAAMAYIEDRLGAMVRIKAEDAIINDNGTPPEWEGILGLSGIQSIAATSYDNRFDAVINAIAKINRSDATTNGGARANLVVTDVDDWLDLITLRTSDGVYILQNPGDAPLQRIWGLPVDLNATIAAGTVLVLDTNYFPLGIRRDMRVRVTDSHGEYFIEGKLAVRVDIKGNVIPLRDAAACKITSF